MNQLLQDLIISYAPVAAAIITAIATYVRNNKSLTGVSKAIDATVAQEAEKHASIYKSLDTRVTRLEEALASEMEANAELKQENAELKRMLTKRDERNVKYNKKV